jgi:hypothetical protein
MLRTITPAEITAARLRRMAADLILEAQALEASAGRKTDGRNAREVCEKISKEIRGGRK